MCPAFELLLLSAVMLRSCFKHQHAGRVCVRVRARACASAFQYALYCALHEGMPGGNVAVPAVEACRRPAASRRHSGPSRHQQHAAAVQCFHGAGI